MSKFATLSGMAAILLWSMSVALTRSLAEVLGPFGAGAAIYTVSGVLVLLVTGMPKIRQQRAAYLWGCGSLFVIYMVCFALAIGMAANRQQTLEIGLINYLWPSLTLLFALPLLKISARWWLYPGILLAFSGIIWVVSGGSLSLNDFIYNISSNLLAYLLAIIAAVAWSLYSNLVRIYCHGKGVLPLFLFVTAACLWIMTPIFSQLPTKMIPQDAILELLLMGATTAIAYVCWDMAMRKGNITLVAALSYFTPLFSILIASLWLNTQPGRAFWPGVGLVVIGSLLCWSASRNKN
ncbi:aromatic amino acid DMT transporter YddG [Budvicia aquatica]|uniref:aromatic amino acid DMT transporter YddG n=1 Tax=Budvicia aquatica TaxID=82979 RepID=UPI00208914E0|nr:aromatic amino acid DMT transporter YddG [Budvicia aquatica]GKX50099.1 aromatic amino acid exporter [Budvicia aquatica]